MFSTFARVAAAGTRPEHELLVCCARTGMDPETAGRLRTLLQQDIDWAYLLRIARPHGMMPLLYWHLNASGSESIPNAILDQLRDYFHANAQRNLFLTGELLTLLKLLEAHGIPAIPYKGPALAASAYGNLALRQFRDLDILVHKQDVLKAKDLLLSQGYQPEIHLVGAQESAYLRTQCGYKFLINDGRDMVDLHWGFTASYFSFPLDPERLWERLKPVSLAGTKVWTFSPEDLLLILCVHGAKHLWERLEWICGVTELIGFHHGMDWGRVMKLARTVGSERMLLLGLVLASDLLGAHLPKEILHIAKADSIVVVLEELVRERLFPEMTERPGFFETALFHIKAKERLQGRIRYCLRLAMNTTVRDWTSVQIPSSLFFLYYPLRAIRLIRRYVPVLLKHFLLGKPRLHGSLDRFRKRELYR